MEPLQLLAAPAITLNIDHIDTDQLIPARFLKGTDKHGLGRYLFYDWRYDGDGRPRGSFILNRPEAANARVLIAGHNFGCGSSREHAPWALLDYGFKAVVSTSFADIFQNNALKNGLLCVKVEPWYHARLLAKAQQNVCIDLECLRITTMSEEGHSFSVEPFARYCLLNGLDQVQFLFKHERMIHNYEKELV